MGMDLVNETGTFQFNIFCWENVLALAEMYGWSHAGTQSPVLDEDEQGDFDDWHDGYFTNDGQTVTAADALAIADALERALDDIPDHNAIDHKTKKVKTKSGCVDVVPRDAEISPLEALSGTNKPFVREFIVFCRQGAFEIW